MHYYCDYYLDLRHLFVCTIFVTFGVEFLSPRRYFLACLLEAGSFTFRRLPNLKC